MSDLELREQIERLKVRLADQEHNSGRILEERQKVFEDQFTESDRACRLLVERNASLVEALIKLDRNFIPEPLDLRKRLLDYGEMSSEVKRLTGENGSLRLKLRSAIKPPPGFVFFTDPKKGVVDILDPQGREIVIIFGEKVQMNVYIP